METPRPLNFSRSLIPTPRSQSPNSNGIKIFANPHSLTPIESNFYKIIGGRGSSRHADVQTFQRSNLQTSFYLPSILRTLFQVPYHTTPLFATLTKTPGVWGYSSHFGTLRASSTFRRSDAPFASRMGLRDLQTFQRVSDLSPFLSHSSKLFCPHAKRNSFIFNQFRTLCAKHPGVGEGVLWLTSDGIAATRPQPLTCEISLFHGSRITGHFLRPS
jgi:hypothetical protein